MYLAHRLQLEHMWIFLLFFLIYDLDLPVGITLFEIVVLKDKMEYNAKSAAASTVAVHPDYKATDIEHCILGYASLFARFKGLLLIQ